MKSRHARHAESRAPASMPGASPGSGNKLLYSKWLESSSRDRRPDRAVGGKARSSKRARSRLAPEDRRRAIMQAAVELFLRKGFAATSLEEVVARSGGSLATVYQLFGNKQGLWQALVRERTQLLTAPLRDPSPAVHDNPRTVLLQIARSLMNLVRSPECGGAYRLILAEGSRSPELAQAMYENGPEACQKQVAQYLREQTERGALNVPDPELAAEQFGNLVAGDLALQNACGMAPKRSPAEIERRLAAAVDLFLRAYAAR